MDSKIRNAIFKYFDESVLDVREDVLSEHIQKVNLNFKPMQVINTIRYMKDNAELVETKEYEGAVRLTLKATEIQRPWYSRLGKYLLKNLISILALIISIFALILK